MTLKGIESDDKLVIESYLNKLRNDIKNIPEDPFLVMPTGSIASFGTPSTVINISCNVFGDQCWKDIFR